MPKDGIRGMGARNGAGTSARGTWSAAQGMAVASGVSTSDRMYPSWMGDKWPFQWGMHIRANLSEF